MRMKKQKGWLIFTILMLMTCVIISTSNATEIKQGDKITIVTLGTLARLCPYPNAGQDQHITRIPQGTILEIEGIMDVKSGFLSAKWFEVTYKKKRGWVSIFDTNKQ